MPMGVGLTWQRKRPLTPAMLAFRSYFHSAFLAPSSEGSTLIGRNPHERKVSANEAAPVALILMVVRIASESASPLG